MYGAQARYVCLDPSWLCRDILGTALAPDDFVSPNLANQVGANHISEDVLTRLLGVHADPHLDTLIQILTSFEICYELKGTDPVCYNFPSFIRKSLEPRDWEVDPVYVYYHGRRLQCGEELDCLPPGLFNRLQVKIANLYNGIQLFKDALIVKDNNAVCLVKTDEMNDQITFIARAPADEQSQAAHQFKLATNALSCFMILDMLHQQLCKLLKVACPNISMKWHILSPLDLKAHKEDPYVYTCDTVVSVIHSNAKFINQNTGHVEQPLDVLYCGSKQVEEQRSGESMPIAFLPDSVFEGLEELLGDTSVAKVHC